MKLHRSAFMSGYLWLRVATEWYIFPQSHLRLAPSLICTKDCELAQGVRPPGFEPGSSLLQGPQLDTRLRMDGLVYSIWYS